MRAILITAIFNESNLKMRICFLFHNADQWNRELLRRYDLFKNV